MLKNYHQHIYFSGLVLLAVSLPLSIFLLSVAQFILLFNWLLENNFKEKWETAKQHTSIFAFLAIYVVHIAGMAYSSDWTYGFHDLKIKLPLFLLPIIIGTSAPLDVKKFNRVLLSFCVAVFISTVISTGKLFGWWGSPVTDVRDISIFISHIRLALMINIAIFILARMITAKRLFSGAGASGLSFLLLWFIFFLIILKSLTGIIILILLVLFFGTRWIFKSRNVLAKWFTATALATMLLLVSSYLTSSISRFYHIETVEPRSLDTTTIRGNRYTHNLNSTDFENGNYTWLYVCDTELEPAWNKRSKYNYRGNDLKGQELRYTLIRYLASKGLRKDSAGVMMLEDKDIRNIEMGMANCIYSWKFSLYPRIYQLLWEIHQYKNGGNPSGHSFTQRMEYLKTAFRIIKKNTWIGTGTGDVAKAFDEQYRKDNSILVPRWRLRAHNQLVTFLLTFGLTGSVIILVSLVYPVIRERKWNQYYMLLFLITGFLSFLNEDTLETHAGISFFAFFYAFFLYNPYQKT